MISLAAGVEERRHVAKGRAHSVRFIVSLGFLGCLALVVTAGVRADLWKSEPVNLGPGVTSVQRRGGFPDLGSVEADQSAPEVDQSALQNDCRSGTWSEPTNLGPVINSEFDDAGPAISKDGLSLFFYSDRDGGFGGYDIWVSHRANKGAPWGTPVNLGPTVNSAANEAVPALSRDMHSMFFAGNRAGGMSPAPDIWVSFRADTNDDFGWQTPVNLGSVVNSPGPDVGPGFDERHDGSGTLYFSSIRPGGQGIFDIYASRVSRTGTFSPAVLVPELNSPDWDQRPIVSQNGLTMFLLSNRAGSLGGGATFDIWIATRPTVSSTWSTPVNPGAPLNTDANDYQAYPTWSGQSIYFTSDRPGGVADVGDADIWVSTRSGCED